MKTEYRKNGNDFTKGSIGAAILHMAIPMMLAQLINVLYSVVDRMYIGHIPVEGSLALTGIGICAPILSIISAFSVLFGAGGGALCSIARGRGSDREAEEIMGCALTLLLASGVILTAVSETWLRPLLYLFGASDVTYPYAAAYGRVYTAGTLFVMLSLGMNFFINAQGFSRVGMLTVLVGAVMNIVLDPIFIYAFHMGVKGAALATILSQAAAAALVMAFLLSKKALLRLRRAYLKPRAAVVKQIVMLGFANFIMNVTNSLVTISCNVQLRRYGGDLYVGAMTVINSIREVVLMIVHGLTQGAQPVLGYNYGARVYSRVRSGIRFTAVGVVLYAICAWGILMLFPRPIISIFTEEEALMAITVRAARIFFMGYALMALQSTGQCVFVALGRSRHAIFFSLLRKVFVVVPLVFLLPLFFGADGVFLSEPISDLIGGVACFTTMMFTVYRRLPKDGELPERHDA